MEAKAISSVTTKGCTDLSKSVCLSSNIHRGWGAVALLATGSWPKIWWPPETDLYCPPPYSKLSRHLFTGEP